MVIEHHPPAELLAEYAAGTAPEAVALVMACHTTLCPSCRDRVAEFEDIGGALLLSPGSRKHSDVQPTALDHLLEGVLGKLDAHPQEPPVELKERPVGAEHATFPQPLRDLIGSVDEAPWRKRMPGLWSVDLPIGMPGGPAARLVRTAAGMGVPRHGHAGLELDLVLRGGLEDQDSHEVFERGDVQVNGPDIVHQLKVLDDVPECIILSINEARWRPQGVKARIAYSYLGW